MSFTVEYQFLILKHYMVFVIMIDFHVFHVLQRNSYVATTIEITTTIEIIISIVVENKFQNITLQPLIK